LKITCREESGGFLTQKSASAWLRSLPRCRTHLIDRKCERPISGAPGSRPTNLLASQFEGASAKKITIFSKKLLAEATDLIDRTRALCEKSPRFSLSVSVA
jgi:hypothetical protein